MRKLMSFRCRIVDHSLGEVTYHFGTEQSRERCVNWYNLMGSSAPWIRLLIHYYIVAMYVITSYAAD